MKIFREKGTPRAAYCDGCARVCDARCRADAVRERAWLGAVRYGFRI